MKVADKKFTTVSLELFSWQLARSLTFVSCDNADQTEVFSCWRQLCQSDGEGERGVNWRSSEGADAHLQQYECVCGLLRTMIFILKCLFHPGQRLSPFH